MKKEKSEYAIQTVTNALRVLEAFHDAEELGVTEIARALDLHKNNVFRLLATLEMNGYIEQRDGGPYRLGTRCLELGRAFNRSGGDLLHRGRTVVEALSRTTSETAHLAVLRDFQVVHLEGRETSAPVRVGSRVGTCLPAHCTALGKVLLACSGDEGLAAFDRWIAPAGGLATPTPASLGDRDKLFEHLRGVSVQRIAVDLEECHPGMCCVAAPVFDETGLAVAALSVSVPSARADEDTLLEHLGPHVSGAAERLSTQLGYTG